MGSGSPVPVNADLRNPHRILDVVPRKALRLNRVQFHTEPLTVARTRTTCVVDSKRTRRRWVFDRTHSLLI